MLGTKNFILILCTYIIDRYVLHTRLMMISQVSSSIHPLYECLGSRIPRPQGIGFREDAGLPAEWHRAAHAQREGRCAWSFQAVKLTVRNQLETRNPAQRWGTSGDAWTSSWRPVTEVMGWARSAEHRRILWTWKIFLFNHQLFHIVVPVVFMYKIGIF
jgi:hypothetical protein